MSYHQRLKSRSPSASETEEQKRRMSQMPTIEELERRLQEAEQSFQDASEFLGVPPEEIPVDDGTPPLPPASVIVSPWYHQLDATWMEPPAEDHVVRAFLRVRKKSNPAEQTTTEVSLWGGYAGDLPVEAHLVDAFFENRWGRRSDWSAVVEATPMLTAAESIDLTAAEIAGSLGWENLDALDANSGLTLAERQAKLGDDVITARAMAAQNLAATRLWAQTGAFESAMIGSLSVDKLTAGTFTAGQITLASGGSIKAGQMTLNASGLTLPWVSGAEASGTNVTSKLNSSLGLHSMYFVRNNAENAVIVQADAEITRRASAIIGAIEDPDNFTAARNASFVAQSASQSIQFSSGGIRAHNIFLLGYRTVTLDTLTVYVSGGNMVFEGGGSLQPIVLDKPGATIMLKKPNGSGYVGISANNDGTLKTLTYS